MDGQLRLATKGTHAILLDVFDVHGDVWEWCNNGPNDAKANRRATEDGRTAHAQEDSPRYLLGGSWDYNAIGTRCGYRSDDSPVYRYYRRGSRIVLR